MPLFDLIGQRKMHRGENVTEGRKDRRKVKSLKSLTLPTVKKCINYRPAVHRVNCPLPAKLSLNSKRTSTLVVEFIQWHIGINARG